MSRRTREWIPALVCSLSVLLSVLGCAAPSVLSQDSGEESSRRLETGVVISADVKGRLNLGRLRSGSSIEAELSKPVYSWDREMLPSGTRIQLVVDQVSKQPRRRSFFRTLGSALALNWRREVSYAVSFRSAALALPDGVVIPIAVSFLDVLEPVRVEPKGSDAQAKGNQEKEPPHSRLILQVEAPVELPASARMASSLASLSNSRPSAPPDVARTVPAGTRARLLLGVPLSASGNQEGDVFHARLLEPIWAGNQLILPEGSRFEGRVVRRKPPRRLSRGGSLRVAFDRMILPSGAPVEIPASLTAAELDPEGVWMDSEGEVHGGSRTKKRALLDLGLAYLLGKLADDLFEEGVKLGVSQAASGTVTAVARYLGIGTGLVVFLGQRGKDVALPLYTELELTFPRDIVLPPFP